MPITTLAELDKAVCDIVSTATGWPNIIKANADAPPPVGEYGTYSIKPIRAYGQPRTYADDIPAIDPVPGFAWQDMRFYTVSAMDVMVSINLFGPTAQEAAMRMYNACFRPPISDKLRSNEIAWRYCSEARDLTYIEQATIERRFQLDWFIYVEVEATDDIYKAASVGIEIQDENGNILINKNGYYGPLVAPVVTGILLNEM